MTQSSPLSLTAVVTEFPAPSQTFIRRKLTGLRDADVDVTVAATTFRDGAAALGMDLLPLMPWRTAGDTLSGRNRTAWRSAVVGAARLGRPHGSGMSPKERFVLAPLLAADSDIVHFEFSGIAVTYRQVLGHLRPAKIAISCRGAAEQIVPLNDPTRGPMLREVFGAADLIHCVSDDIRRTAEELGAPPERIVVNRPAVPVEMFAPLASRRSAEPEHHELRVLSIGRLHWKKGFDDALRAISTLRGRGRPFHYRIAGEGPEREKLAFLIEEYGLGDAVELLGSCASDRIRQELAWADVLLLPSLSEGISNAVLEAMAAGLPVVSTDCGGMAEVITHGVDGFLVPVGDTGAIADHLELLGGDIDVRASIGRAATQRAGAEFDLSRQVEVFLDAYRSVIGPSGR